jgi:competence protein ComEA
MQPKPPSPLSGVLLLAVMVVLIVLSGVLLLSQRDSPPVVISLPTHTSTPLPSSTPVPSPTPTAVQHTVYITGAVRHPNSLHTLPDRSRIGDAVAAAGGALPEADLARVNLAAFVRDGEQIHIPTIAPTPNPLQVIPATHQPEPQMRAPSATPIPPPSFPIRINYATRDDLMHIPGIGEVLADRIIAFRTVRGSIALPSMLLEIQGIGQSKLDVILPYLRFD